MRVFYIAMIHNSCMADTARIDRIITDRFAPEETVAVSSVPLVPGYACEECGAETGLGWVYTELLEDGSDCGIVAICTPCMSLSFSGLEDLV